jgi:hypothetical protein
LYMLFSPSKSHSLFFSLLFCLSFPATKHCHMPTPDLPSSPARSPTHTTIQQIPDFQTLTDPECVNILFSHSNDFLDDLHLFFIQGMGHIDIEITSSREGGTLLVGTGRIRWTWTWTAWTVEYCVFSKIRSFWTIFWTPLWSAAEHSGMQIATETS